MVRIFKASGKLASLALALGFMTVQAQTDGAKTLETGTFHGKVHNTSGRATIYQEQDGKLVLRLSRFKTSKGRTFTWSSSRSRTRTTTRIF